MYERFTEVARQVVMKSQDAARSLGHEYIGTEHLLLGLIDEEDGLAARVLADLGASMDTREVLVTRITEINERFEPKKESDQIPFTPRAKKVLELALREALSLAHNYIGTEHILLALIREGEGVAIRSLDIFEFDLVAARIKVLEALSASRPGASQLRPAPLPIPNTDIDDFLDFLQRFREAVGPLAEDHPLRVIAAHLQRQRTA